MGSNSQQRDVGFDFDTQQSCGRETRRVVCKRLLFVTVDRLIYGLLLRISASKPCYFLKALGKRKSI